MEIELSLIGTSSKRSDIEKLLKKFEQRTLHRVKLVFYGWDSAWARITSVAKTGTMPSVSEVGTSWVPDLAGMRMLKQVPDDMMKQLGGGKNYVPQSWRSCFLFGKPEMWAMPWISGSRVMYYRKDLLEKAKIDLDTAFANPRFMLDAVDQLQGMGVELPWITSNVKSLNTLHLISTWVWAGGGDFLSEDGWRLLFTEPGALDSMTDFFQMGRFMGSKTPYTYSNAIDLFWRGEAAITMDGTWMYEDQKFSANLNVLDNLGVALPPGPAFVGGSNLVVWANKADQEPAWELVRFLSEPDSVLTMSGLTGLAPASLNILNSPQGLGRSFGPIFNRAIETGRSLSNHRFSAMVEDNLHYAFGLVWADLLKSPDNVPHEILKRYLMPLRDRLVVTMQSGTFQS